MHRRKHTSTESILEYIIILGLFFINIRGKQATGFVIITRRKATTTFGELNLVVAKTEKKS